MTHLVFHRDFFQSDPFDARRGHREVTVDDFLTQSDRFEDLGAVIAPHGGDPHLREYFHDAFHDRLDVACLGFVITFLVK